MRAKRLRLPTPERPREVVISPHLLDMMARRQESGLEYYGESVHPPWKRQRKKTVTQMPVGTEDVSMWRVAAEGRKVTSNRVGVKKPRKKFTDKESEYIIRERNKSRAWERIGAELGRSGKQIKKHFYSNLKTIVDARNVKAAELAKELAAKQPPQGSAPQAAPGPKAAGTAAARAAPAPAGAPTGPQSQNSEHLERMELGDKRNLYNKIVVVEGKMDSARRNLPQLYFVLTYNEFLGQCHLVPLCQDGKFGHKGSSHRAGRRRFKLVPEGKGEELHDVAEKDVRIIRSEAINRVSDADKEAWDILDKRWE